MIEKVVGAAMGTAVVRRGRGGAVSITGGGRGRKGGEEGKEEERERRWRTGMKRRTGLRRWLKLEDHASFYRHDPRGSRDRGPLVGTLEPGIRVVVALWLDS
jgi:hypothetical protein